MDRWSTGSSMVQPGSSLARPHLTSCAPHLEGRGALDSLGLVRLGRDEGWLMMIVQFEPPHLNSVWIHLMLWMTTTWCQDWKGLNWVELHIEFLWLWTSLKRSCLASTKGKILEWMAPMTSSCMILSMRSHALTLVHSPLAGACFLLVDLSCWLWCRSLGEEEPEDSARCYGEP